MERLHDWVQSAAYWVPSICAAVDQCFQNIKMPML
jgi:hypothetical protein